MMRTDRAGDLRTTDIDREVVVCGWVDGRRDHGGVVFLDVRDVAGILQVVVDPGARDGGDGVGADVHRVRNEYVVRVEGTVRHRPEGTVGYHNSWVTDFVLTPATVAAIVGIGRSRWKIENEQFNVQKNHGYELEHNYGHGQQTLSMVFYLLNLLAFLAHKLLEFGDRLYQQCRVGESRRGLWTLFRSAFYLLEFDSWDALLRYHLRETAGGP